ncbi:MAG TPA: class I SAM-dependent methyltransferase, partial [Ktedonobacteraceae bacterium]|nr:class I SAM-dependent methyltransferase [Ktedonobacteraceae bacterium]
VFNILASLLTDEPRAMLDVGTGSGDIARHCVEFVDRVDAVDCSPAMLEKGKHLSNGDHPRLNWIVGKVEEVALTPPYALITAGSSIHWTEWSLAFPRFRAMLTTNGFLAVIHRRIQPMLWDAELRNLRAQFSARRDHRSSHVLQELEMRGLFHRQGEKETAPVPFIQSIDDFIEGLHSRSDFSKKRMGLQKAMEFDRQVRALLLEYHQDGILPLHIIGTVIWGIPGSLQ